MKKNKYNYYWNNIQFVKKKYYWNNIQLICILKTNFDLPKQKTNFVLLKKKLIL